MNSWAGNILLFISIFLVCNGSMAQMVYDKPLLNSEQRRKMAIKLLEPIKKEAQQNPNSHSRTVWLENYASIDPQWTAEFIINNPIENSTVMYDIPATARLMLKPGLLRTETVLKLLQTDRTRYFLFNWAGTILTKCKPESELYKKVLELVRQESKKGLAHNVNSIISFRAIAAQTKDQDLQDQAESEVVKFFESGNAKKQFDQILSNKHFHSSYTNQLRGQFMLVAPEKYHPEFGHSNGGKKTQHDVGLQTILQQVTFSDAAKNNAIQSVDRYVFGNQAESYMNEAGFLGLVAKYDLQQAMRWANDAPNNGKSWAKLLIAPAMAKQNQEKAIEMIEKAYEEISQIDPSSRFMQNYNYPAPSIACAGLPIVEAVAPAYIPTVLEQTIRIVNPISKSRMSTTRQHIFKTVASIARYDLERAKSLFDQHDDFVDLNSSPDFFRALLATDPDKFWEEFEQIPEKDSRGIEWPLRIRLAVLPALCQDDDSEFWNLLSMNNLLPIDPTILSNSIE